MKFIAGLLIGLVLGFGVCYANMGQIAKERAKNDVHNVGETLGIVKEETSVWDVFDKVDSDIEEMFE